MKMESLIVVFCSKLNLSIKDFVDVVLQLRCTANSLGVALENLPVVLILILFLSDSTADTENSIPVI
jgi:hypothetical protein